MVQNNDIVAIEVEYKIISDLLNCATPNDTEGHFSSLSKCNII